MSDLDTLHKWQKNAEDLVYLRHFMTRSPEVIKSAFPVGAGVGYSTVQVDGIIKKIYHTGTEYMTVNTTAYATRYYDVQMVSIKKGGSTKFDVLSYNPSNASATELAVDQYYETVLQIPSEFTEEVLFQLSLIYEEHEIKAMVYHSVLHKMKSEKVVSILCLYEDMHSIVQERFPGFFPMLKRYYDNPNLKFVATVELDRVVYS